jgi:hypothetical protein
LHQQCGVIDTTSGPGVQSPNGSTREYGEFLAYEEGLPRFKKSPHIPIGSREVMLEQFTFFRSDFR